MGSGVKDKYHVAINGKGYMLNNSPANPAYARSTITSEVNRLAISDINYADFSGNGLFYVAQTDWSAGFKDEKMWKDDGQYYSSSNIDAYSEQGLFKLEYGLTITQDLAQYIYQVYYGLAQYSYTFLGTDKNGTPNCKVYSSNGGAFTDISGTSINASQNIVSQLLSYKNSLYVATVGNGMASVLMKYDGSSWTDLSPSMHAVLPLQTGCARAMCVAGNTLYIGTDNSLNNYIFLVSYDGASTYTKKVEIRAYGFIISMAYFNGLIYYLVSYSGLVELRAFDPSSNIDVSVWQFKNANLSNYGVANRYMVVFKGDLIITIPNKEIYRMDTSGSLTRVYRVADDRNYQSGNYESGAYLYYGCIESNDRLYWGNLVWDGEAFYNFKKPYGDPTNSFLIPIGLGSYGQMYYIDQVDPSILYQDDSNPKSLADKNFLVSSEISPIASIDKLLYSITVLYDRLNSGETIKVEYSINDRLTWTVLGTISYVSGNTETKKELIVPGSVIFNKIWVRIKLTGSSTSPKIKDWIIAYRPMPNYKNQWSMRLDMTESVKLLNKQEEQRSGEELAAELWNNKSQKQRVLFEDVDYVEGVFINSITATQTSAAIRCTTPNRLPRQGRIRAVSGSVAEEMYYTSAEASKIKGIVRGARGTVARSYNSNQVFKNDYDVVVDSIKTEVHFIDENKNESIAQVTLIEV